MFEPIIAFLLILFISSAVYLLGRWFAPRPQASEDKNSMYACGEKTSPEKLLVNFTSYRYLVYFVIIDSSALIFAFAALALEMNVLHLLIYLLTILIADFLLLGDY